MVARDARLLFMTRSLRMFAFGSVGVILALFLHESGLPDHQIGAVMTVALLGDAVISLMITLFADRVGRKVMLLLGCALKVLAAALFALPGTLPFTVLATAACIGVVSPSGNEVGPFMALEQSILSQLLARGVRTTAFAWYNVVGYASSATGSAEAGLLVDILQQHSGFSALQSFKTVFWQYGLLAILAAVLFTCLSGQVEALSAMDAAQRAEQGRSLKRSKTLGLSAESVKLLAPLSALFALDSFAGSLITGSLLAYYFKERFNASASFLGALLFVSNMIAGASSLSSGWIANRIGLINTMVFTHLPSNVLTILIPFMPTMELASAMVFLRYSISQMDVAPRQSFVAGIVPAAERTATMGVVNVVKSLSACLGPLVTGYAAAGGAWPAAFALCGGLKIMYDLALLYFFGHVKADVERAQVTAVAEVGELRSDREDVEAPLLEQIEDSRLR